MRAVKAKALRRAAQTYMSVNGLTPISNLTIKAHPPKTIVLPQLIEVPEVKDDEGNVTQEKTFVPKTVTLFPKTAKYDRGATLRGAYLALKDSYNAASR